MAPEAAGAAGRNGGGEGRRLALLVSSSDFTAEPTLPALPGVHRDAAEFAGVLADPRIGAFEVETVTDRPTHEAAVRIQKFLAAAKRADTVLLYLSGHGVQDPRGRLYFAAVNTVTALLESTALDARWLLALLENCRARRQIVILDCCFSGALGGIGMGAEVDLRAQLVGQGSGRVLLTSSRGDQQSFQVETAGEAEREPGHMSVFTAGLVDGLRTGNADRDRDGVISVEDAFEHAVEFVHDHGSLQNPQRWLQQAEGKIVLAFSARRDAVSPLSEQPGPPEQPPARVRPQPRLRLVHTMRGDDGWMYDAAFTPDGSLLATASGSGVIRLWDTATGSCRRTIAVEQAATGPWHVAISADGRFLAVGGGEGALVVFALRAFRMMRRTTDASRIVHDVAISSDGELVAAALGDLVSLWDTRSGNSGAIPYVSQESAVSVAFRAESHDLAVGSGEGAVRVWTRSLTTGLASGSPGPAEPVLSLAYVPGRNEVAYATGSAVLIWQPEDGSIVSTLLHEPDVTVAALAVSPDGSLLASATDDGSVHLWDLNTCEKLTTVVAHDDGASVVAFHPTRPLLASAGGDQAARLWELPVR